MLELCSSPRLQLSLYPPEDEGMKIFTVCGPVAHKPNKINLVLMLLIKHLQMRPLKSASEPVRETFTSVAHLTVNVH